MTFITLNSRLYTTLKTYSLSIFRWAIKRGSRDWSIKSGRSMVFITWFSEIKNLCLFRISNLFSACLVKIIIIIHNFVGGIIQLRSNIFWTKLLIGCRATRGRNETWRLGAAESVGKKSEGLILVRLSDEIRTFFERNWRRASRAKLNARAGPIAKPSACYGASKKQEFLFTP